MNLGLTVSFIVGGMVLVMVLTLNLRMGQHATEMTLHGVSQMSKHEVVELIEYDFSNIGYNLSGAITAPIHKARPNEIEFKSNILNDPGESVQTVAWRLGDVQQQNSANPDHRLLYRIVDSDTTAISLGVSEFEIRYFEKGSNDPMINPDTPGNRDRISRIEITLVTQSRDRVSHSGNNDYYPTSAWRKTITPPNLNLNN